MSRRGFTLVELMVSIALTTIVVLFLYKALSTQQHSNDIVARNALGIAKRTQLYELIYADLLEAQEVRVEPVFNKDYTILFLHTTNSLHQIPFPYVAYYVHENNRTLVRLESAYALKFPVESEMVKYIFADRLLEGVQKFIVQERGGSVRGERRELLPGESEKSKDKNGSKEYLLFLKWPGDEMLIDMKKE